MSEDMQRYGPYLQNSESKIVTVENSKRKHKQDAKTLMQLNNQYFVLLGRTI